MPAAPASAARGAGDGPAVPGTALRLEQDTLQQPAFCTGKSLYVEFVKAEKAHVAES